MDEKYHLFIKKFILINFTLIFFVVSISDIVMRLYRENYSDNEVLQNYENVLYGSILKDGNTLKFPIVEKKQPNVIALGSSRVMPFRAAFFLNKDFYTMGGLGSSVDDVVYTWNKIKTIYTPKVVILGIDPWWINPNYKLGITFLNVDKQQQYRKHIELFRNNKIRRQLLHLDEIKAIDEYGQRQTVGLNAAVNSNGFRLSDGSYQNGREIRQNADRTTKFADTYKRMREGKKNDRFVWCDTIDYAELEKLSALLQNITVSGTKVIVFLPPFPHEVYTYMDNSIHYHDYLHAYIDETEKMCSKLDVPFYNFCDLASIGASDDEAIDGFHGSETAYAQITALLGKNSILAPYVNHVVLDEAINHPLNNLQAIPATN
ncbi:MAG: hypothetical protein J6H31_16840 [Butyrivibrio sp.]|nr:hypothetical protein [Butyrivibrio sp.]